MDSAGRPPNKDDFARLMIDTLRQAGEPSALRYESAQFRLVADGDESQVFNLANVYEEYCRTEPDRRREVLRRVTRSWFARLKEVPKTFDDVHPDLLPGVRNRSYYELTRLQARV